MRDTHTSPSQLHKQSRAWLRVALLAILLLAFGLRLVALDQQDIWWDEARNLDVALRPLSQIAGAHELDIQPPLYYYTLHGWLTLLGVDIGRAPALLAWSARWWSVAAGVALVALVAALARRVVAEDAGGAWAAVGAALLGALSPFWLAESQETRMYTLCLALLTAAAWALLTALPRANASPPTPRRAALPLWIVFVLCSSSALLVHYNAVFVLVAWYLWWGVRALAQGRAGSSRWRALRTPLLCGVATLLLFAPIIPVALRQIPDYANPNLTVPSVFEYVQANVRGHLAGYTWDAAALGGYANWWLWGSLALLALGVVLQIAKQGARRAWEFSFLLVWLIGASILYYIAVLDRGAFNIRYSALVTPALFALAGAGIAGWQRVRLGAPILLLVALGMLPFVRSDLTDPRFFREDISGVTAWLRANTSAEDLILVDQKYPFGFYYERFSIDPAATPAGSEAAPARYLFVDINTLDAQLQAWATDAQRVFWVQWFESDTDPRRAVPFLLEQNGAHAGDQWFQGWSIDWWQMQPPNNFTLAQNLTPHSVRFANAVETVAVAMPASVQSGAPLPVTIRWQRVGDADNAVAQPLKARVALYDAQENRLAQADERLLNDRHVAPSAWAASDQPLNVYLLQSADALAPGVYTLRLLVYDADTLAPLDVLDGAGNPAGIEATLGEVTVTP